MKGIVQKHADKYKVSRNKVPSYEGGEKVSQYCVKSYQKQISHNMDLVIKKKVNTKDLMRVAAENSLRSTVTYLMTIAATHFIQGNIPKDHQARKLHGSKGARKMRKLMKKALGKSKPFYPVYRSLISSSDETTCFVSPSKIEKESKNDEDVIASDEHNNSTQMYCKLQSGTPDSKAKGMRVKLTFTFVGHGKMLDAYITVAGLTERELPKSTCPDGILIVPIPGLCMERHIDPKCQLCDIS